MDTNRRENYQTIFAIGDSIWVGNRNSFYNNNSLFLSFNDTILKYNNLLLNADTLLNNQLEDINFIYSDSEGSIWVADEKNGLLKFTNSQYQESFIPDGPKENSIFSLEFLSNKLYACHGGHINFGSLWNKNGASGHIILGNQNTIDIEA